jgi:hypothetical protein
MADAGPRTCSRCGQAPAGGGGVLCGACRSEIESQLARLYGAPEDRPDESGGEAGSRDS